MRQEGSAATRSRAFDRAAYVLNATVVPTRSFPYLTLWPAGSSQPYVSTLNGYDGAVTSSMAIVPTNNGKIDAYACGFIAKFTAHEAEGLLSCESNGKVRQR